MSRTTVKVENDGDPFGVEVDTIDAIQPSTLEHSVARAFGREAAREPVFIERVVRLNWKRPGPNGVLVPR
jgi:hypothetical protein